MEQNKIKEAANNFMRSPIAQHINPPKDMGEIAAGFYRDVFKLLVKRKRISVSDIKALEVLCQLYEEIQQHRTQLLEEGYTYETNSGLIKKHPVADMLMQKQRTFKAYCMEFGLTPVSRGRTPYTDEDYKPAKDSLSNVEIEHGLSFDEILDYMEENEDDELDGLL